MSKVLVVEDEKDILENLDLLLTAEGYEVICAENGLNALQRLTNCTPDIIVSDIMMPYMDGFELFQKLRENDRTKIIPFIFLTAKNDITSIRSGMNLGVDDYITKPFSSDELLNAIKVRLSRYSAFNEKVDKICENISMYVPHELRTPLTSIMGFSQIIISEQEELNKNEILEMIHKINHSSKRLLNRIEKFIQFTESNPLSIHTFEGESKTGVVTHDLIKEIFLSNYITAERKEDFIISVEECKVKIPHYYLVILINELLENAVKFSDPGKVIKINGLVKKHFLHLEITDKGIGMTRNEIDLIGAFKQYGRETRQQQGNGLGLITVKNILNAFDGKINITSQKNNYTTVAIMLPAAN